MTQQKNLISEIEAFLKRKAMPPTRFGLLAMNDSKFVFHLREGRDIRRSTEDHIRVFMQSFKGTPRQLRRGKAAKAGAGRGGKRVTAHEVNYGT